MTNVVKFPDKRVRIEDYFDEYSARRKIRMGLAAVVGALIDEPTDSDLLNASLRLELASCELQSLLAMRRLMP